MLYSGIMPYRQFAVVVAVVDIAEEHDWEQIHCVGELTLEVTLQNSRH